jgi:hypothetical protein
MRRLLVAGAVLLIATFMLSTPSSAQRSGSTAGGPGAYGRPGELRPGQKPRISRAYDAAASRCRAQVLANTKGSMGATMTHRTVMYTHCMRAAGQRA